MPADPTVRELVGDAWQELSGYDGRVATTFKSLLHPGRLTSEYLLGHRSRYLSPVRLYLTLSVLFFLVATAAPVDRSSGPWELRGPGQLRVGMWTTDEAPLTDEERAEIRAEINSYVWPLRVLLQSLQNDPIAFRSRMFTVMPRVFFALLPVFAGIVWLFYRRRRFPAALVFATHVHAFAFLAFTFSEAAKFSQSAVVAASIGVVVTVCFVVYVLRALRAVFGDSWPWTLAKAAGIGVAYSIAALPAFFIMLVWASLT